MNLHTSTEVTILVIREIENMGTKLKLISAEEVHEYLSDEWARERLYDVDYAFSDKHQLALYKVTDLSQRELIKAIDEGQSFLLDETD